MPIIASATKRARQNVVRKTRLQPFKSRLKTAMRQVIDLVQAGKKDEARALLGAAMKTIDTAAKKGIIHPNNASRKVSRLARLIR